MIASCNNCCSSHNIRTALLALRATDTEFNHLHLNSHFLGKPGLSGSCLFSKNIWRQVSQVFMRQMPFLSPTHVKALKLS